MERAGHLIGSLNRSSRVLTDEELVRAAWPLAVGPKIARYATVAGLVRTTVVVEVSDMVWQRQLNTLRSQIAGKLTAIVGPGIVDDLALRPMGQRRMAQQAETVRSGAVPDEADAIANPSLRRAYKISRKKASA
jgi:hypothetical protein